MKVYTDKYYLPSSGFLAQCLLSTVAWVQFLYGGPIRKRDMASTNFFILDEDSLPYYAKEYIYGYFDNHTTYSEDGNKIAFLKKELKNKHLNPGLRVQYAKELQRLEK